MYFKNGREVRERSKARREGEREEERKRGGRWERVEFYPAVDNLISRNVVPVLRLVCLEAFDPRIRAEEASLVIKITPIVSCCYD